MERGIGAGRQLHHRFERRPDDQSAGGQFGLHAEQCDAPVRSTSGPGVGCFRQREDCGARRIRHLLFVDRRSQLPAELASRLTTGPFPRPDRCPVAGSDHRRRASVRPARSLLRKACSPTPRPRLSRNGISRSSSNLSHNTVLRVAYVGSFGYHGFVSIDPNTIPAQICSSPARLLGRRRIHGASLASIPHIVPQGAQYIPGPGAAVRIRIWARDSSGTPKATAATTRCKWTCIHRFSHGLQFRANYTWSKDLDMNSALTGAQANNQPQMMMDRNDLRRDWGPSAYNIANSGQHFGHLRTAVRQGQALGQ